MLFHIRTVTGIAGLAQKNRVGVDDTRINLMLSFFDFSQSGCRSGSMHCLRGGSLLCQRQM